MEAREIMVRRAPSLEERINALRIRAWSSAGRPTATLRADQRGDWSKPQHD
ncbi:MAG: hypothetical protein ACLUI3_09950 [Christensenellales bacterium]